MLKRTTGRWLLTLLVVTGLAGTLHDGSLSKKERKQAIGLFKNSKTDILSSISGLSEAQMNYKPSPAEPSIRELFMSMLAHEKKCSDEIRAAMTGPANSEKRLKITVTDEQLLARNNLSWMKEKADMNVTREESIKKFNMLRNQHIKYIRTSTQDLRNHVLATPAGWIDCYQYYLLMADQSIHIAEQIKKIRSSPGFPAK